MSQHEVYLNYQKLLGEIPEFLYKYLELDFMIRLKDVSIYCAMDYASFDIYDFKVYISRFNHSLNTALITWKLTHSKEATLAALFHDVSTPIFSHVVDIMNNDSVNQESTEKYTRDILLSSNKLKELLDEDGIDINDILDFKEYSIVDLDRPGLCADRLDGIISFGISWFGMSTYEEIKRIIDSLIVVTNENGVLEIAFDNQSVAEYVFYLNQKLDEYTHSNEDYYMMNLGARILKKCLSLQIFTYWELFLLEEHEAIEYIEEFDNDLELNALWLEFKTKKNVIQVAEKNVKKRDLNPLVFKTRLNNLQSLL